MLGELSQPVWRQREKRGAERRSANIRTWVQDPFVRRLTRIVDISLSGARILTAHPPKVGTRLSLLFQLSPDGAKIEARAVVIWRSDGFAGRGGVMGIQFSWVSHPQEISNFVQPS